MRLGLLQPPAVENLIELGRHAPDVLGGKAAVFHRVDGIAPAPYGLPDRFRLLGGIPNPLKYPVFPTMPHRTALPKLCKNSFPSFMKMV